MFNVTRPNTYPIQSDFNQVLLLAFCLLVSFIGCRRTDSVNSNPSPDDTLASLAPEEAGEFWRNNIFQIGTSGDNLSAFEPNRLFLNTGEGKRFIDASFNSGANIDSDSRSVIAADINLDGKPDLLVGSAGGGPLRLFLNQVVTDNRFLNLQLPEYSGSLVGTRIILHTSSHLIYRDLFPVNACLGQAPIKTTFGIPAGTTVKRATIRWPNGKTVTYAVAEQNGALQIITKK